MTHTERVQAVLESRNPDRMATLCGWLAYPRHLITIAGATDEEYKADPGKVYHEAYRRMGIDALVCGYPERGAKEPDPEAWRIVDHETYTHAKTGVELEDLVEKIDAMPEPEKYEDNFDLDGEYQKLEANIKKWRAMDPDIVYLPAQWDLGSHVTWYSEFGYENFFLLVGLYPERVRKLLEIGGAVGHSRAKVIARAVRNGIFPKAVFMGEDICTQRGCMISVDFMEKYYAPTLKYGLEPLKEVDCRPVWHSDGDTRKLIPMLLESGVRGFQGFQPECGVTLDYILKYKPKDGGRLLFFGPMAVTTELPVLDEQGIRQKVRDAFNTAKDKADILLFTSNTVIPDTPVENVIAMYDEATKCRY
ncbi:MAG: hypothetical protein PHD32_01305 [Eubacteriales bacterium]|nr:hypothetical protein [Eubacteriales bacterium]